jgi:hypothetical protein
MPSNSPSTPLSNSNYYEKGVVAIQCIQAYYANDFRIIATQRSEEALNLLRNDANVRRALFFINNDSDYTPFQSVINIWLDAFSGVKGPIDRSLIGATSTGYFPSRIGEWFMKIFESDPKTCHETLDDTMFAMHEFVRNAFPRLFSHKFLSTEKFWRAILGKDGFDGLDQHLTLQGIYNRLNLLSNHFTVNNKSYRNLRVKDGASWIDYDADTRERIILQISSKFPEHLQLHLDKYKKSYAYLDDIVFNSLSATRMVQEASPSHKAHYTIGQCSLLSCLFPLAIGWCPKQLCPRGNFF